MRRVFVLGLAVAALAAAALPSSGRAATASGSYTGVTVGTSDTVVPAAPSSFLDLHNVSNTATICIRLGAAATISGTQCAAGSIPLPPGWHKSWEGALVPSDTVHAISSEAGAQLTVGVK